MTGGPEASPRRRRLFFALWPDERVAGWLAAAADRAHRRCGGRTTRRETLHLTLAFLGDVEEDRLAALEAIGAGAAACGAFDLCLDRIGYWRHNHIVWAGASATPIALTELANGLTVRLKADGFRVEDRPFAVHVTLLRKAVCREAPVPGEPMRWPVRELLLMESELKPEGARYTPLRRWPLAGEVRGPAPVPAQR